MLVTSFFSFFHNIFCSPQNKLQFLNNIYSVVCKCFQFEVVQNQGPKNSRKGTRPSGRVSSKRYSSCFHFHLSIFQSIQTERVAKLRCLPSELGRFLEFMPVFLSYKLRFQMKFNLLDRSINFSKCHRSTGHLVNFMAVRYINLY